MSWPQFVLRRHFSHPAPVHLCSQRGPAGCGELWPALGISSDRSRGLEATEQQKGSVKGRCGQSLAQTQGCLYLLKKKRRAASQELSSPSPRMRVAGLP